MMKTRHAYEAVADSEGRASEPAPPRTQRRYAQLRRRRRGGMDLVSALLFMMIWSLVVLALARYLEMEMVLYKISTPLLVLLSIPLLALLLVSVYEWCIAGP